MRRRVFDGRGLEAEVAQLEEGTVVLNLRRPVASQVEAPYRITLAALLVPEAL